MPSRLRVVKDGYSTSVNSPGKMASGAKIVSPEPSTIDSKPDVLLVSIVVKRERTGVPRPGNMALLCVIVG
jgi:hypothetical protein